MRIEDVIKEKIQYIEDSTNNTVRCREEEKIQAGACIDWERWSGQEMAKLPWILHKHGIEPVHIFHELIHLEKFFIDHYSLIATNSRQLHGIMGVYKNIPEDYVTHKLIFHTYGFDPIDRTWFERKDTLGYSVDQIAANLVNYHAFIEFCPEFNVSYQRFHEQVRQRKRRAFNMSERAISALESMAVDDRASYNECADKLIQIFTPNYYGSESVPNTIYTAYLRKSGHLWAWV